MNQTAQPVQGYRFGAFEVDLRSGELRKGGIRLRVQEKPFQILVALLERPGEVVGREEFHHRLWNGDIFVEFDHNLNNAVARLREALADSADAPRFIETLQGRGYRFLAPVEVINGVKRPHPPHSLPQTQAPSVSVPALPKRWGRLATTAGAVLLLAGMSLGVWWARRPAIAFQQRDWVLITRFENRTGEAIFDGMLEYALERELSNSRFVNVVARDRIGDALQLMKKPPNTPIDVAAGREICLRDGGIRALLNGQIERAGAHYLLSVNFVEPASGVTLASLSEEAETQDEILPAVRSLSNRVRETLGEELSQIQPRNEKLEKATTPSLRALRLYSQGMALVNERKWPQAAAMLEQAIAEDSEFASAHIYLAHSLSNLRRHEEAGPHYERAFALADKTTDRERYFILGSYYSRFLNDYIKAVEAYEVLVRLYPDDYWGTNNLVALYAPMGRIAETIPHVVRSAELRPHDFAANVQAARVLLLYRPIPDPTGAKPFFVRAEQLATPEAFRRHPFEAVMFRLLPAYESYFRGDLERTLAELTRVHQTLDSPGGAEREVTLQRLGFMYVTLGKLAAAEEVFEKASTCQECLLLTAWVRGDRNALREQARRRGTTGGGPAVALARSGLIPEAQKALAVVEKRMKRSPRKGVLETIRGEILLARGREKEAIPLLQTGVEELSHSETATLLLMGADSLARIWERQGDLPRALQTLERVSRERIFLDPYYNMVEWMRIQAHLAQLYRKAGREKEAQGIETRLRKLLTYADADHPLLIQLKRLQDTDALPTENPTRPRGN